MVLVLNFSHPVTPEQEKQISALIKEDVEVVEIEVQLNLESSLASQLAVIVDQAVTSVRSNPTMGVLMILPGLPEAAAGITIGLASRLGFCPRVIRRMRKGTVVPPVWEVAEILDWSWV